LTCSSHDTQMALLPASMVRSAARLVFTLVIVVAMLCSSARGRRN
jgi:disulfide bond formation protein DsbB